MFQKCQHYIIYLIIFLFLFHCLTHNFWETYKIIIYTIQSSNTHLIQFNFNLIEFNFST